MAINLWHTNDGIHGHIEYSTDLFEENTIAHLVRHYEMLLHSAIADPSTPLSQLSLLTPQERQQVLRPWNDTKRDYPRDALVHEVFAQRALETPNAVALEFGDITVSYAQLDARASLIAQQLRQSNITPGAFVALYCARSVEMVVNMLGILKAGAAYVPFDPGYPVERLKLMLEIVQPTQILGENIPTALLAHYQTLCQSPADQVPRSDNPAYVMYTSGSTGTPKGVIIPHRGILRLVCNSNYLNISSNDIFLQHSAPSFDASTFEIWGALLNGARLVLLDKCKVSVEELSHTIEKNCISILWLTTGLFDQVVQGDLSKLSGVHSLLTGGDVANPASAKHVLRTLPRTRLLNCYGPTENTTFSTCFEITEKACLASSIPIGRPIANSTAYIVDQFDEPAPIGVTGEIYLGGDGLAVGYLHDDTLSDERFVQDPFAQHPQARVYRTGDLGRFRHDGQIEFVGRRDEQIKVRGFRIEPGEITNALLLHPEVKDALVIYHDERPNDKRLIAYVVPKTTTTPSPAILRDFLTQRLPEFMVPSACVVVESFVLTANGKIDRRNLPKFSESQIDRAHPHVVPGTSTEQTLAAIWTTVLGCQNVGIHDHFFNELGGHSLLATQLLSRIVSEMGVSITLQRFFEQPTIAGLADALLEAQIADMSDDHLEHLLDQLEEVS